MADAGARVYLSVIPDKNYFAEANGYPAIDCEAFVEALREQTDFAQYIDLFGQLTLDDYYRTDSPLAAGKAAIRGMLYARRAALSHE